MSHHAEQAEQWIDLGLEIAEHRVADSRMAQEDEHWAELTCDIDAGTIKPDQAIAKFLAWRRNIDNSTSNNRGQVTQ